MQNNALFCIHKYTKNIYADIVSGLSNSMDVIISFAQSTVY